MFRSLGSVSEIYGCSEHVDGLSRRPSLLNAESKANASEKAYETLADDKLPPTLDAGLSACLLHRRLCPRTGLGTTEKLRTGPEPDSPALLFALPYLGSDPPRIWPD